MIGHVLEFLIVRVLAKLFPSRYRLIPRVPDLIPLLRQFKILSIGAEKPRGTPPWWHVSIYLQSFVNAEVHEKLHMHRWRYMLSFVLSGGFCEERYPGEIFVGHKAPSVYLMDDTVIHRLAYVRPRTWTLFVMIGRNSHSPPGGWGYLKRPSVWRDYRSWDAAVPTAGRVPAL